MTDRARPILFVHGWGGPADLVRDFSAADEVDPYAGWNRGRRYNLGPEEWTKYRELGGNFEGMVLRFIKDHGYVDVVNNEALVGLDAGQRRRTAWVFRYYERNSPHLAMTDAELGNCLDELIDRGFRDPEQVGDPPASGSIEQTRRLYGIPLYACELARRLRQIVERVYAGEGGTIDLVGHSMGGLIARFALQYDLFGARQFVHKLATLATPHDGAKVAGFLRDLGRLSPAHHDDDFRHLDPDWVRRHLHGAEATEEELLPRDRVYALVGCNRREYYPGGRRIAQSDGVVRQQEAFLKRYPWTYVFNAHSAREGITQNLEPYEILQRFLLGGRRVAIRVRELEIAGDHDPVWFGDGRFFFHHYVKPCGVNVHLNEISERCENAPRPRTKSQWQQYIAERGGYLIYDGFIFGHATAPRPAIHARHVPRCYRPADFGVRTRRQLLALPTLSVEFSVLEHDPLVGGHLIDAGRVAVPIRIHDDRGGETYAGSDPLRLVNGRWTWAGRYARFLLEVETRPDDD